MRRRRELSELNLETNKFSISCVIWGMEICLTGLVRYVYINQAAVYQDVARVFEYGHWSWLQGVEGSG